MLEDALQWVEKNVKEDADLEEFRKMIPSAEELAKHPEIKPHFDRAVTSAVKTHDTRFTEEKLPDIIKAEREKIFAELNPKETEEQKQLRETREEIAALKRREADTLRKAEIRKRASELEVTKIGLQPDDVETFSVFGEDALPMLDAFVGKMSGQFNTALEAELAAKLGKGAPKAGVTVTGAAPKTMDEANQMARTNPDAYAAMQASIIAQEIEKAKTS